MSMNYGSEDRRPGALASEGLTSSASPLQDGYVWCNMLVKFALFFFSIAMWYKGASYFGYSLLILVWILDRGPCRFRQMIREPFVLAILGFCAVLALGALWGDGNEFRYFRWHKYLVFLIFIPFLALLNKERVPWAISGLLVGYFSLVLIGAYQRIIMGDHGGVFIPGLVRMNYLHFSPTLGIGVILALYLSGTSDNMKVRLTLWFLIAFLLFFQIDLGGRGPLLATLLTSLLVIFMLYKSKIKIMLGVSILFLSMFLVLAYNGDKLQGRLVDIKNDTTLLQLDDSETGSERKYRTGVGYRLAIWDIGLHAISQQPVLGYGSGMALSALRKTAEIYKDGYYRNLPASKDHHFHNDLIEIGVYAGVVGLLAYAFFLWSWFKMLRACRLTALGVALPLYLLLIGLTDTTLIYNSVPTLFLVITAVAISWQKERVSLRVRERK